MSLSENPYQTPNPVEPIPSAQNTHFSTGHHNRVTWVIDYVLFGPLTGALIGFGETLSGVAIYCLYGQPDFYYRSLESTLEFILPIVTIGGGLVGIFYGGVLFGVLRVGRRLPPPRWTVPLVVASVIVIDAGIKAFAFETGQMILATPVLEMAIAFLATLAFSRPSTAA